MMRKFMFLTTYGLKKKFKSKAFIISNIVLVILLALVINVDVIINFFGGDFDEKVKIYVVDNSNEAFELFKVNYEAVNVSIMEQEESDYEIIKTDKETNQLHEELEYTNESIYHDGVKLEVIDKYLVPIIEEGMIVFIGEKENERNNIRNLRKHQK